MITTGSRKSISCLAFTLAFGFAVTRTSDVHAAGTVQIAVDTSVEHQTWHGFGATHMTLVYGGAGDVLSASQRQKAVDALFKQVRISTGQAPTTIEAPSSSTLETFFASEKNDDANPLSIDPNGFYTGIGDAFKTNVVDVAGSSFDLYPDVKITDKWANKWMNALMSSDYDAFLNECAEQALAGVQYWKTKYGVAPQYAMLFNEPLSGNGELVGGSTSTVVDIVRRTGERLEAGGFGSVKLVVPGEETEPKSLESATAILADPVARKFVGAIAYHPYPYGSTYSYVPNILSTSGAGKPDAGKIQLRNQLRDLGGQYGIPVWMTEVSHAYMEGDGVQATDFRILRGRAIHIHDELVYADAAAYFGMNSLWDSISQANHFGTDGSEMTVAEHDTIVLVEQAKDNVIITSMGRAIGHYARFITRGAKRIEATSNDPLVLVSAFRDDGQGGRLVLIAINNAAEDRTLEVTVVGAPLTGSLGGEQSTATAVWQPVPAITVSASSFSFSVPAESVTTVASEGSAGAGPGGGGASGTGATVGSGASGGSLGGSGTGAAAGKAGSNASGGARSNGSDDSGGCGCRSAPSSSRAFSMVFALLILAGSGLCARKARSATRCHRD